jgi:hypothetical protein
VSTTTTSTPASARAGDALLGAGADADRGAHPQPLVLVTAGVGVVLGLLDVLHRDHAAQLEAVVHHQHLLDAVLVQQGGHLFAGGPSAP